MKKLKKNNKKKTILKKSKKCVQKIEKIFNFIHQNQ